MSYNAKGRVQFTSNKATDALANGSLQSFIDSDILTRNLADAIDSVGYFTGEYSVIRRLAAYAGFDLSDSETGFKYEDLVVHTFRHNGDYDDYKVKRFVNHFVGIGMGVVGEFTGEDGAGWEYWAEVGSGLLTEFSLASS